MQGLFLLGWFLVAFGGVFFAHDLKHVTFAGWNLGYWFAAQGGVLFFLVIVVVFAFMANQHGRLTEVDPEQSFYKAYKRKIHRAFVLYLLCLAFFLAALALGEYWGLSKRWVGSIFLIFTVVLYAAIGIYCRSSDETEYYVAGRRVPAVYNGMATAADWMSAASFISLAGGLYLQGFSGSGNQPGGLAYILGWTGGFCLVAILIAPYLRKLEIFTLADFFELRFGGQWPRRIAALAAILCSLTYVVAQIYGVGLITSRLTGVQFEIGILLGLSGVLVCSFLGGMRAVTWTQVAQYVILILAFLIPLSWLSYKQLGNPLAPFVYAEQLQKITELEQELNASPAEQQVIEEYARRAKELELKLRNVENALEMDRDFLTEKLRILNSERGDSETLLAARKELKQLPKDADSAREVWTRAMNENLSRAKPLGGIPPHAQAFAGNPDGNESERHAFEVSRNNFLALMFCLMIGTAGLPHLLTRFFTTPSVSETRNSVAWSLFFIGLLYLAAPALAVLVKFEVMNSLVGQRFDSLPPWMAQWARVDASLLTFSDVNGDQVLQFAELKMGADLVMLATPELGGLPYVVSGLVAAGGLAAALSTADGLLLTIGNAISNDLFFKGKTKSDYALSARRVIVSKFSLLVVAIVAAYVAVLRSTDILSTVTASFSIAGSAFVPAMLLGIFWTKTSRVGAVSGMLVGLAVSLFYMLANAPGLRSFFKLSGSGLWFDIQPVSAGIFGVAAGFITTFLLSLLFPNSDRVMPDGVQKPQS
jgi:cation/acetate symporter